ncbi:hypothetical protein N7519_002227 [Penicillium mononematosum]|uniref:uncharacterized protein n=1 Tax=Penicillium mononematosum TaxID=268346 RepID=UPI00254804EA|nr:uncharacterized protein N7519_002227 [Penicillium mononematosum]KAJ6187319.1 hypothetical protein N7519_002227 [Penicillium mononematosum]
MVQANQGVRVGQPFVILARNTVALTGENTRTSPQLGWIKPTPTSRRPTALSPSGWPVASQIGPFGDV